MSILKFFFDSNEKQIKKLRSVVESVNALESEFEKLTSDQLKQKTDEWKSKLRELETDEQKVYLDEILPQAFAIVREGAKRSIKQRHFDAQLMAGLVLHQGKIAEQKTGEGKTLTATLPLYLNALAGHGAHLVTPNDYLSRHGAGWMGRVYDAVGLSVGVIMQERGFIYDPSFENNEFEDVYARSLREVSKQDAYRCDIVYGTNHEFGFDYLRDNMVRTLGQMVQTNPRGEWGIHYYAIVDEVDSILIDVARTPLIISTSDSRASTRYHDADRIITALAKGSDYEVDEKFRSAVLTDLGVRRVERMLNIQNLYEQDFEMVHLIEQALIAHALYEKDTDYIVKEGKVVIIDQHTGRLLPSNRYSHGLHQAIEAKENVAIQEESKTLAEVSYQNYFRMYKKLAGMTGTALTEAEEFFKIYKLEVVEIPTNKPCIRADANDMVYKSKAAKWTAVANEIESRHKVGQPVLVGTVSVEASDHLHDLLTRKKIQHEVLNAKNHEKEALFISQAGKKGAVTISTNMAGRGVDILLGGDPGTPEEHDEVAQLGGLHVIGTERHESRRIDNQLRGRSGRQGDPGSSRFYISLQDDLMKRFGGEQVERVMEKLGMDEAVPLEAGIVTRAIESAQKRWEGFNFDQRKQVVEMDDVINTHRDVVYKLRKRILELEAGNYEFKDWLLAKIVENSDFNKAAWEEKEKAFGPEIWIAIVTELSLPVIDFFWMDHLVDMEQVRQGIGLRGYAQRDWVVEYKVEAHERFGVLISKMYSTIGERLSYVSKDSEEEVEKKAAEEKRAGLAKNLVYKHGELGQNSDGARVVDASGRELKIQAVSSSKEKVGRNDPCPCGSGKKFKNCHGK